jgi:hypothetical protein
MKELLGVGNPKSTAVTTVSKVGEESGQPAISKKRKVGAFVDSDSEEDDEAPAGRKISSSLAKDDELSDEEEEALETPVSSPRDQSLQSKRRRMSTEESDSDDDELAAIPRPRRKLAAKDVSMQDTEEDSNGSDNAAPIRKDVSMIDIIEPEEDDEDDEIPVARPVRRRTGPVVDDSSDDE